MHVPSTSPLFQNMITVRSNLSSPKAITVSFAILAPSMKSALLLAFLDSVPFHLNLQYNIGNDLCKGIIRLKITLRQKSHFNLKSGILQEQ